ncbi:MAG: hypothetical protein GF388_01190, partial [Candidatus Aegiribacteria sp.]|nr:hypothetical protein [Candidatus Aegiribacteria sp.]MBD3293998.1 hypothetical protein [Candidatus Fermentibacteria bacterium]
MIFVKPFLMFLILCGADSSGNAGGVSLVLSGGGARGFAHVGVLLALEEEGVPIQSVTGAS